MNHLYQRWDWSGRTRFPDEPNMLEGMNQLQRDLDTSRQHWESTFNAIADPIFLHDEQGRIVRANRAYAALANMPQHALYHRLYWECFPKLIGPLPGCSVGKHAATCHDVIIAFEDPLSHRSYLSYSYCVRDESTRCRYGVHFIQDVTTQQQSLHRLEARGHELRMALEGSVRTIATAVEMRDPYTAGHQRRVGNLARAIGDRMGLLEHELDGVYFGGIIHDIGKIHIPAEILTWPGRLSPLQYALVQEHPAVGHQILRGIQFPWPIADIVLQHHERLDGSGYPQGLSGEQICIEAQIVAVADIIDAMSTDRPYRSGLGIDRALEEVLRGRGTLYNAEVVDACVELFRQDHFDFSRE